jgi:hypothetical protein
MDRKDHWEGAYATKPASDVSWFEDEPRVSLELIEWATPSHGRVIDVGGGASVLVDRLLSQELGPRFELVRQLAHTHMTPWGKPRRFFVGLFPRV